MAKEKHKFSFKFFKCTVGNLFMLYYKPRIINKEVIPKEGPVILCGNHIHVFDQNTAIMSTKRNAHYMAKIEYFQGKFAWFFKATGCIPVDREAHDGKAMREAEEILNNGFVLGLFPEGTRNQISCKNARCKELYKDYDEKISYEEFVNKFKENMVLISQIDKLIELKNSKKITEEEYKNNIFNPDKFLINLVSKKVITKNEYHDSLLLPIKFGTVKMAQKTGATIVPYGISGKYKRKGNLTLRFGEPFKVSKTDDLEKINKKLFDEIIRLKTESK